MVPHATAGAAQCIFAQLYQQITLLRLISLVKTPRHPHPLPAGAWPLSSQVTVTMLVTCSSLKGRGKKKKPITGARHCCLKAHDSPTSTWYQKTKPNPPAEANCCSCHPVVLPIYHSPWAPARATSAARDRVRTVLAQVKTSPVPSASSCSHT